MRMHCTGRGATRYLNAVSQPLIARSRTAHRLAAFGAAKIWHVLQWMQPPPMLAVLLDLRKVVQAAAAHASCIFTQPTFLAAVCAA